MMPIVKKYMNALGEWCVNLLEAIESWDYWNSLEEFLAKSYDDNPSTLSDRMYKYVQRYNHVNCHPFKPHIISLKSPTLLKFINRVSSIDDKYDELKRYNAVLNDVCKKLYDRFDPQLVYSFENEIHLVYYFNDNGNYLYDGNINKTLTTIASHATSYFSQEFGGASISKATFFEATFVEFDEEYETLNYIVWRQMDCKRNIVTLLYKCLNHENVVDGSLSLDKQKVAEMETAVITKSGGFMDILPQVFYGNIIKKQLLWKETSQAEDNAKYNADSIYNRKQYAVEHFPLHVGFNENMKKYIINKYI